MTYITENDLVYDENGNLIVRARYDEETGKIFDIADLNLRKFYIDENGIKHIRKYKEEWQELECKWNDELVFDESLKRWRVKTEKEKLEEIKQQKINELKQKAYEYIISHYPLWKQSNDLSDKETIVIKLIAMFDNVVTADDIRKSIYNVMAGHTTSYMELVKYGVKAGYIQTDENGFPLYTYELKDGSTIVANINREYKDSDGNKQIIPQRLVVDRHLLFTKGVNMNIINEAIELVDKLLEIVKRIVWKDSVRAKVDELEQKILNARSIDEVNNIDLSYIEIPFA